MKETLRKSVRTAIIAHDRPRGFFERIFGAARPSPKRYIDLGGRGVLFGNKDLEFTLPAGFGLVIEGERPSIRTKRDLTQAIKQASAIVFEGEEVSVHMPVVRGSRKVNTTIAHNDRVMHALVEMFVQSHSGTNTVRNVRGGGVAVQYGEKRTVVPKVVLPRRRWDMAFWPKSNAALRKDAPIHAMYQEANRIIRASVGVATA